MSRSPSRGADQRPRLPSALGACLVAATLAGCGSSSSGGSGTSAGTPNGAAAKAAVSRFTQPVRDYPAVSPIEGTARLRGKTVWFVPLAQALPNIAAQQTAMRSALQRIGVEVHVCDGQLRPTTIASCLDQARQQGADAVVTAFVGYKTVPAAIDRVTARDIPLLVAGEADDAGPGKSDQLGFWDNDPATDKLAELGVDAAVADGGGTAHILYVGANDSPTLLKANAAAARRAKSTCPKCTFHALTFYSANTPKLPSQVSAALIKDPDTDHVVVGVDPVLPQVLQGIGSAGFRTKVKVSTLGADLAPMQIMKSDSTVIANAGVNSAYLGWGYADGIIRMMLGGPPKAYVGGIRVFDRQDVTSLPLTPAAYTGGAWYGSDAYKASFLRAWAGR